MAAKKLSERHNIQDITLVDICEEEGIPRASAYHFFPNVEAIFLALRFLNYMDTFQALEKVEVSNFDRCKIILLKYYFSQRTCSTMM